MTSPSTPAWAPAAASRLMVGVLTGRSAQVLAVLDRVLPRKSDSPDDRYIAGRALRGLALMASGALDEAAAEVALVIPLMSAGTCAAVGGLADGVAALLSGMTGRRLRLPDLPAGAGPAVDGVTPGRPAGDPSWAVGPAVLTCAVHGAHTGDLLGAVIGFLRAEAALSNGGLTAAEAASRAAIVEISSVVPHIDPLGRILEQYCGLSLARSLFFQGRLAEAAGVLDAQRRRGGHPETGSWADPYPRRGTGHVLPEALMTAARALIVAASGDRDGAVALVDRALMLVGATRGYFEGGVATLCAFALATAQDHARAGQLLLIGGGGPGLPGLQLVDRAFGYEMLAVAALEENDPAGATEWVGRAGDLVPLWSDGPSAMARCALDRAQARLAEHTGAHRQSLVMARSAERAASTAGGRIDAVQALLLAGVAQAGDGDRAAAITDLDRAADEAGLLGATVLRGRAVSGLRSLGRRSPPITGLGLVTLSERERQIADLLARGRSNQQIAGQLGLSARTVQGHVTRVLRAFGVPNRWAIPHLLDATDTPGPRRICAAERAAGAVPGSAVGDTSGVCAPPRPDPVLSKRPAQVAALAAVGRTNAQIGAELGISVKTVEKHLGLAYSAWRVNSRAELAVLLRGRG